MQFLLNNDSEDTYKESIEGIIASLKEEEQIEIDKLNEYYLDIINELQNNLKNKEIKESSGVLLLEEKLKLDIFNTISAFYHIHSD
jgi:hypothetical protein